MHRRQFLAAIGVTALAGCTFGSGEDPTDTATQAATATDTITPTATATETVTPTPTPTVTPEPADLSVRIRTPLSVQVGEQFAVDVIVTNLGQQAGQLQAPLRVVSEQGGVVYETDLDLAVAGADGQTRTLQGITIPTPGTYEVTIRELDVSGSLTVEPEPTPTPTPEPTPTPDPEASRVKLNHEDAETDSESRMEVDYNNRSQFTIAPRGTNRVYRAPGNDKFLIVRMRVENTGDGELELTPAFWDIDIGGAKYSYQPLDGFPNDFRGVTLDEGGEFLGWSPYSIPKETREAALVADQSAYFGAVTCFFGQDNSIDVDVPTADEEE